jgi:hypothetical protein
MPPRKKAATAPPQFKGRGRTLDAAVEDAYTRARARKTGTRARPGLYEIVKTEVDLRSPINEYRVTISPSG